MLVKFLFSGNPCFWQHVFSERLCFWGDMFSGSLYFTLLLEKIKNPFTNISENFLFGETCWTHFTCHNTFSSLSQLGCTNIKCLSNHCSLLLLILKFGGFISTVDLPIFNLNASWCFIFLFVLISQWLPHYKYSQKVKLLSMLWNFNLKLLIMKPSMKLSLLGYNYVKH